MEINIDRVLRDGLDMEKNFLEHVELRRTRPLSDFSHPDLRRLLDHFYQGEGSLPYLGLILNAVFTQEKVTFYLDYRTMTHLIKGDLAFAGKEISTFLFRTFLEKVTRGGFIKQIGDEEGIFLNVYTLIHPDLLKFLYKTMGKESIAEQRSYVIQYVKGLKEFQREEKSVLAPSLPARSLTEPAIEREDEIKIDFEDQGPPPIPSSSKQQQDHVFEGNWEQLKLRWEQEKVKYKVLSDKARAIEALRLSKEGEDDMELCRQAVEAATEARKQEKLLMDLELAIFRSQGNSPEKTPE